MARKNYYNNNFYIRDSNITIITNNTADLFSSNTDGTDVYQQNASKDGEITIDQLLQRHENDRRQIKDLKEREQLLIDALNEAVKPLPKIIEAHTKPLEEELAGIKFENYIFKNTIKEVSKINKD